MKVGIDARMMGKGYGLGRYIEQLVSSLAQEPSHHEFVVFLRQDYFNTWTPPNTRWKKVLADVPWYSFQEQYRMPSIVKKEQVDLMHYPHWNIPIFSRGPFVVTIHDLTMFHFPRPEATTRGRIVFLCKDRVHRFVIRLAVRRARHIITASEFTKDDVHRTLGVSLEKMTTIYQAPFEKAQEVRVHEERNIGERPYVLYVGAAYPHKNIEGLLNAWRIARETLSSPHQLILVGREDYFYKRIQAMIAQDTDITYLGLVSDASLEDLYARAALFVCPSLYEGFGFPPLEAQQHHLPVVSSNRSSLPEILGEGAVYVDPEDALSFAQTMVTVLDDPYIRSEIRTYGKENVQRFSWTHHARKTLEIYLASST